MIKRGIPENLRDETDYHHEDIIWETNNDLFCIYDSNSRETIQIQDAELN